MTQFSLFPSFVQVFYHSEFSPHVMTLPTRQWSTGPDQGTFLGWDSSDVDADTMINNFITKWADLFIDTVEFDYYAINNFESEESLPTQVAFGGIGTVGGVVAAAQNTEAVELTITWACNGGFILKTVGLDAIASANFEKVNALGIATLIPDIVTEITAGTNAWASRAGTQPLFGKQIAYTLNERLRRSYHQN